MKYSMVFVLIVSLYACDVWSQKKFRVLSIDSVPGIAYYSIEVKNKNEKYIVLSKYTDSAIIVKASRIKYR
jgi:hypothetical protein